ncbi:protein TRACHEARY ELEMENT DIFFERENTIATION-RELATED 7A-like [Impatiens glandulifera]|uniref:protein TRACHEARY ELEMENT DIFFERENTIATION-RELATED 7A-like n=1 Tax=Impatiens glandulifera TaxID=253017 RepID=UPI001FB0E8BF|nr:protein TRACHEARY ELEMENT DIFFERENTIATION-RELATED 7A-like [Impatiens glandulifera]
MEFSFHSLLILLLVVITLSTIVVDADTNAVSPLPQVIHKPHKKPHPSHPPPPTGNLTPIPYYLSESDHFVKPPSIQKPTPAPHHPSPPIQKPIPAPHHQSPPVEGEAPLEGKLPPHKSKPKHRKHPPPPIY